MADKTDKKSEKTEKTDSKLARGASIYWADPDDDCQIIGLDTPDGPEHPLYDPRIHLEITEPEIRNVEYHGIVTPVKARRGKTGKLEIIEGRQRVRKARIVKARQIERGEEPIKVPVLIEKSNDDAHLFGLSRAGNVSRNDGPMTTAQNVQRYLAMGRTVQQAADTFGVSEQTIRNYQALLDAHKDVISAMVSEEISSTAAVQIVALPHEQQKEVLDELRKESAEGHKPTVERVKRKVAEKQGKAVKTPKERIENARKLLMAFAGKNASEKTKEEMAGTLERMARVLFSMGLDKLVQVDEE